MSATRTCRTAAVSVIACVVLLAAIAGPAVAEPTSNFKAQEQYYSSYGDPEPLTVSQSPAPSDDTPWLAISLTVAALLAIVAGVVAIRLRRHRVRRHAPQVIA